uniref:Putative secreted protein n=1 Tax=Ixodes ricinus TaxID=34613 RepID=A0A6B0UGV4_IXORI
MTGRSLLQWPVAAAGRACSRPHPVRTLATNDIWPRSPGFPLSETPVRHRESRRPCICPLFGRRPSKDVECVDTTTRCHPRDCPCVFDRCGAEDLSTFLSNRK